MRTILITLIMCFFVVFSAGAETPHQQNVREISQRVGDSICYREVCFGKTLQAIAFTESTFGLNIVGGGDGKVRYQLKSGKLVKNSSLITKRGVKYTKIKGKLVRVYLRDIEKYSLGTYQICLETAKEVIRVNKLTKYNTLLQDDLALSRKLLYDVEFGAIIAGHYLRYNYREGLDKNKKYPWKYSVSRYNGGTHNKKYIQRVSKNIRKLK